MKKINCPTCGEVAPLKQSSNTDMGQWKKQTKKIKSHGGMIRIRTRWVKVKKPSAYVMIFSCSKHPGHPDVRIVAKSKAKALAEIGRMQ